LQYLENLAFLKMYRGALGEAEQFYRNALQARINNGGNEQAHTLNAVSNLAECLLLSGSAAAAGNLIRDFVSKLPSHDTFWSARKALARCLSYDGMQLKNEFSAFEASRACYELSLEIDPESANTHNNYALLLWVCLNEASAAAEHFKQSMLLDPKDGRTCGNYAHLLAQTLNDPEQALAHFEKAMLLSPNDDGIPANFAALLMMRKRDLAKAWRNAERSMRICLPSPDRTMARPLFVAAAILALQRGDPSVPLGQLKSLFARGIDHVPWVLTATLNMLDRELNSESSRLLRSISHAIDEKSRLEALAGNPLWRAVNQVAFEVSWPPLVLQHASSA